MDDKSSNQNPFENGVRASEKKPLDWVSILLSGVAAVLIIVGIYFLNQSVSVLTPQAQSSSSSSRSSSSVAVSSSVSSSSSVPAFDPATAPLKNGSTNADIKIKVTSVDSVNIGGTTTETGFTGTRWFRTSGISWGAFDASKFTPTPKVGEDWRLELIVTSDQTTGAISAPGAIQVVKAYKL